MIDDAVSMMNKGGRICIITFHSLEDRIVKNEFKELSLSCVCPPELPICQCDKVSEVKVITRKPILPSKEEVEANPRSRSAKLRVAEKNNKLEKYVKILFKIYFRYIIININLN